MEFELLLRACMEREKQWDPEHKCDLSFLGNALGGEIGEAQNVIKKLERARLGMGGKRSSVPALAEELADAIIYIAIIAMRCDINLWEAVVRKFNLSSDELGLTVKI